MNLWLRGPVNKIYLEAFEYPLEKKEKFTLLICCKVTRDQLLYKKLLCILCDAVLAELPPFLTQPSLLHSVEKIVLHHNPSSCKQNESSGIATYILEQHNL